MIRSSSCPPWPPEPTSDPTEDRRSYTTRWGTTIFTIFMSKPLALRRRDQSERPTASIDAVRHRLTNSPKVIQASVNCGQRRSGPDARRGRRSRRRSARRHRSPKWCPRRRPASLQAPAVGRRSDRTPHCSEDRRAGAARLCHPMGMKGRIAPAAPQDPL